MTLRVFDADQTRSALPFDALIPALREAFAAGAEVPLRHHHHIPQADGRDAVLLLMPAWQPAYIGVKIVTIFSGNTARNLPGVYSTYLLSRAETGEPLALMDGNEITGRRTLGVSALAASYLARADASSLLIVGAGRIASLAAEAFRSVRPIGKVAVWDIDPAMAARLVERLRDDGFEASVAPVIEDAVRRADIVSCATLSKEPLIQAAWLKPGAHLDLIGSFTPAMREAEDACFALGPVFADSGDALKETGDLIGPIEAGVLDPTHVGTLAQLCGDEKPGRRGDDEITVFKAVGTALSDIAAGVLAYLNTAEAV